MMEVSAYEENDQVGEHTLNVISDADNFNKWIYHTIKPHCKGKLLEIGSGIGNISNFFLQDGYEIMLTDLRKGYCSQLELSFGQQPSFLGATVMDLNAIDFDIKFNSHFEQYDTVFAINVVEHISDDTLAVKNAQELLKEGGRLIILVPSYQKLYNLFDKELGHFRRYNKSTLSDVFLKNNFEIIHKQYFNFMGIFGWYVNGKILNKETIPNNQMKIFNFLIPIFKIIDKVIFNTMGLSTIVVGKKKQTKN